MPPDAAPPRRVVLRSEDVTLDIDLDAGARAVSWTVAGVEVLARYGSASVNHGMYAMAPWAGRLRDNRLAWGGRVYELPVSHDVWALHGTCLAARSEIVEHERTADGERLVARMGHHPDWPWPMLVDLTWDLRGRELVTVITVHAKTEPFPAVVGWHPWFRRELATASPAEWSLQATGMLERGDDHLPTGGVQPFDPEAGPFDDAFLVPSGRGSVRWPGELRIDIESSGAWFVVFDELAAAVCVEPQSGPPDGLHVRDDYAPPIAAPGRPAVMTTRWVMTDERPGDPA